MLTLVDEGCPICESRKRLLMGKPGKINDVFRRYRETDAVEVARCFDCSGMYVFPMIYFSEALQKELYNIQYFNSDNTVQDMKNIGEKERLLGIVRRLMGGCLRGECMLDIGCGTGEFLKVGADLGMTVTGIDVEKTIASHIQQKYGFEVVTGTFGPATFPKESFDVIILSHVIEHLQKPLDILKSIHVTLKTDGLFMMCTPNTDSLMEDLHNFYGKIRHDYSKAYYLTPFASPYHIVGFNERSTSRILERAGFSPVHFKVNSGLEWEDANRQLIMKTIKVAGLALGKGMSINTISRKV